MITDVPGITVGHWTDTAAETGCTVVLLPEGAVVSGEIRGGAPGTREWALLDPSRTVEHADAIVMTGGSAFGLAACDGVVRYCEEQGLGYETRAARVPIVVGMVLYDLAVGDPHVRPGADEGYAACISASSPALSSGRVGAGAGATVGNWYGEGATRPGGLGSSTVRHGDLVVAALVAVNALGDLRGRALPCPPRPDPGLRMATTLAVVATNAALTKLECHLLARLGHDGYSRALEPVHTSLDGDAVVAVSVPEVAGAMDQVHVLGAQAVEEAIVDALSSPEDPGGHL